MPGAIEFLQGFGLTKGKILAGYTLINAAATHEIIKQYREYQYKITLTFANNGSGTYDNLYYVLEPYISATHTIYGVRNPYRCVIDEVLDGDVQIFSDDTIVFSLTGHSYRIQ